MSHHKYECVECFDPEILEIIRCVCNLDKLVDDVFKCLSCRPSSKRLQQILTCVALDEVRKVENLLTNETFGLNEIKIEVRQIEAAIQALSAAINADFDDISQELANIENNPVFGLRHIESEVRNIVNNPVFGLRQIESEVRDIENNPTFGLRQIESEIRAIESELRVIESELRVIESEIHNIEEHIGIRPCMTTGPVFIGENARHLTVQVLNNTSETHTVDVRVMRIDKQPFQEIFSKSLEIPPFSAREFKYIDLDSADCCDNDSGQIEVILCNLAEGLYPTIAQFSTDDKIIPSSIFKSCEFMAKIQEVL